MSEPVLSKMFPKLHPHNLVQLKALQADSRINEIWFHADGNMFIDKKMTDGKIKTAKQHSDDRKTFHNECAANNGAKFRTRFGKNDPIPADLKEMEALLVNSYQGEEATDGQEPETRDNSFTFDAPVVKPVKTELEETHVAQPTEPQAPFEPAPVIDAKIPKKGKQLAADLAAATGTGAPDPDAPVV